jgi:hypothetical protein
MAYYDALRTQWALLSGTTAQKLAAVNALTANVAQPRGTLTVSQIIGAIAASLTNAVPWWQANGYTSAINASDLVAAGGLT